MVSVIEVAIVVITTLFSVLFILFVVQSIRHHRTAFSLLLSLFFGVLGGVATILGSGVVIPLSSLFEVFFLSLQLNLFGFQFFFFYIFLERLISDKVNTARFTAMLCIFLLQTFGLWFVVIFRDQGAVTRFIWFIADIAFLLLGMVVYLGFGFIIYIRTYLYTHEIKPIVFSISMVVISLGSFFIGFKDVLDFFYISIPFFLDYAVAVGNALFAIGIILFTITYVLDIDYIYRLPHNVYLLMVLTRAGIPIHTVKLQARRDVRIESGLLSGLISAVNSVFEEIFKTSASIQNISSREIHLLMNSGEEIVCLVITDKLSYFLNRAIKRYTRVFEEDFGSLLRERLQDTVAYDKAVELIRPIFPFFKVEKIL